jgi:hypothetical protein
VVGPGSIEIRGADPASTYGPSAKGVRGQLGGTLKFIFDHFVICDGAGNDAALRMMQERADWLDMSINLYAEVLGERAYPREGK